MEFSTRNAQMARVLEQACRLAPTGRAVLLQGEPGTGREHLARYIHAHSGRAEAPFIKVEGPQPQAGLQAAAGGTAYLPLPDGAETAPPDLAGLTQAAALAGARLIAAASIEPDGLEAETISLPPLRERREDLELLTQGILLEVTGPGMALPSLSAEVIAAILLHDWPGNLPELRRVLLRARVQSAGASRIALSDLPRSMAAKLQEFGPKRQLFKNYMHSAEKLLIRWALAVCEQDRTRSARFLGLSRAALYKKLKHDPDLIGARA